MFLKRLITYPTLRTGFGISRNLPFAYAKYGTMKNDSVSQNPEDLELKEKAHRFQLEASEMLEKGKVDEALDLYTRANQLYPSGSLLYNIANCAYQKGDIDGAIDHWEQSAKLMPSESDVHVNLANVYYLNKKNPKLALEHLKIASSLSPKDGEVSFNYGCILEATGNLKDALGQYKSALENGIARAETNIRNVSIKLFKKQ
ncbi:hypothetical protein BB560_000577 [Smittium megazygosporum]|uniref:MalT-like TPR region domain-containing protein n=1 Tax=Smittium megazygosporum TaxID=133381 RepID=A0A2T9Z283_9FUNG|nr:hypothetical protein BB560_005618 [Smittium megazygosporum]PVV04905.1 hypothetical protein BB560_000577 [Smittium megazygosporum]